MKGIIATIILPNLLPSQQKLSTHDLNCEENRVIVLIQN